jgi:hypothetical protein
MLCFIDYIDDLFFFASVINAVMAMKGEHSSVVAIYEGTIYKKHVSVIIKRLHFTVV